MALLQRGLKPGSESAAGTDSCWSVEKTLVVRREAHEIWFV